ncbi:hypothetical protein [Arthrobacter psychrolactophilus]|nr:hypothetical protein [Arthrobacter psychrolactophilus]
MLDLLALALALVLPWSCWICWLPLWCRLCPPAGSVDSALALALLALAVGAGGPAPALALALLALALLTLVLLPLLVLALLSLWCWCWCWCQRFCSVMVLLALVELLPLLRCWPWSVAAVGHRGRWCCWSSWCPLDAAVRAALVAASAQRRNGATAQRDEIEARLF